MSFESKYSSTTESLAADTMESSESKLFKDSNYEYLNETPFPIRLASSLCVMVSTFWALFHIDFRICVYLYATIVIILCYVFFGAFGKSSPYLEMIHRMSRYLATTVPIAAVNAHMQV